MCSDYGTQSSLYRTLQFIFHQLFWLVRRVRCTIRYSSYCNVLYNELCVPVRTTGGIWTVMFSTTNSAYYSEQLVKYELQRAVQRTLRTSQNNCWNMNCAVLYTELCVPVRTTGGICVLTGTQSSVYCTLVHIPPVVLTMVRRVRCTARYSSYSTSCSDWYAEFGVQ
jgi:hypothetical protein